MRPKRITIECRRCGQQRPRADYVYHVVKTGPHAGKRNLQRTCAACRSAGLERRSRTIDDRLWSAIDRSGGDDACWPWLRATDQRGYGLMRVNGKQTRVTRLILVLDGRPLMDGRLACHTCDNPACCNPDHLYAGTPAENVADRETRGRTRFAVGEDRRNSKLTAAEVRLIRQAAQSGECHASIARRFTVTPGNIAMIVARKTWKHVP